MSRLFGTDGVRGVAGAELTCELAYNIGRAGAYVLTKGTHKPKILVGRDTRISGQMLEAAICAGICSVGAEAEVVGVIPTPAVAYLTRRYKADAGIIISASHNPFQDNGIKFFNSLGFKLPDETEDEIEHILNNGFKNLPSATGRNVGKVNHINKAEDDYVDYILSLNTVDISGMKVVIDCANGAASHIAPRLLAELGVEVISVYDQPNGHNINDGCGSTHMKSLCGIVEDTGACMGLAFDGDADRMLAVDEKGNVIDGDVLMLIYANYFKQKNILKSNTLVTTVMSNMGLNIAAKQLGIDLEITAVGDRYVLEAMREKGYNLGGEQSGHFIFLDDNTTGDGMLSALRLMESYKIADCTMSELSTIMKSLPQILIGVNIDTTKKVLLDKTIEIQNAIKEIEESYQGKGRVLVRPSGTEPLIRVMIEGEDQDVITKDAQHIADVVKKHLG
ncbi:MAG: phosphoglucosamine mutase [Clostridiales bacterium]|nr:phosphoglucosamine mutase [Clostridiales bacterium]